MLTGIKKKRRCYMFFMNCLEVIRSSQVILIKQEDVTINVSCAEVDELVSFVLKAIDEWYDESLEQDYATIFQTQSGISINRCVGGVSIRGFSEDKGSAPQVILEPEQSLIFNGWLGKLRQEILRSSNDGAV